MPRIKNKKFETFNDGVADFYKTDEKKYIKRKGSLHYGKKTVGVSRFYKAKVASDKVDKLIAVPDNPLVKRSDLVVIGREQYKILQIQEKFDICPSSLYVSLERSNIKYKKLE